ncbi:TIR domain-containing protein [Archangium gephyra]|uniref:TIR domain-containing protein n=1 Tax=Archangium gephyra TaxID=48 RepID=UPI0035D493A0
MRGGPLACHPIARLDCRGGRTLLKPIISWLHLSDIHFGHGSAAHGWNQHLVLSCLQADLTRVRTRGVPPPELILVTGDIAFSGATRVRDGQAESTEYQAASQWLRNVGQGLGIKPSRIFTVPGNHDVQRSADHEPAIARLVEDVREGRLELDAALADPRRRALLARRQAHYLAWAAGFAPACTGTAPAPEERLFWTHRLELPGGLGLRLVGLNTALLSADDADRGRLWLGTEQLARALLLPPPEPHECIVVLSHHPFRGHWLADEQNADAWIRNHAHLHLSGHVHEADSEQARSGAGGSFVRVVSGAAHGEQTATGGSPGHGYNLAAVFLENGGQLVLRVWPRRWSEKNKTFVEDQDNVPPGQPYSEHPLNLKRAPARAPPSKPLPEPRGAPGSHAYDIALSFAGEDREVVEHCARRLSDAGYRVFYDLWEQHTLWGKDLTAHLDEVYRGAARYCLLFISKHYVEKSWTRHELRSAQAHALRSHREYILPVRLDDTPLPGVPDIVGYIDLRTHSVERLVQLLEKKLGPAESRRGREEAHEDVEALLQSTEAPNRLRGLMKATRAKDPRHLARLLEILGTDEVPRLREQAAMALGELRDPRTKDCFLAALEDSAWEVRSQAGWGLVHLGEAVREDVLQLAKLSKNPHARLMAQLVLNRL